MKKNQLTALLLTAAMSVSLLAGCGNSADTSTPSAGTASGTEGSAAAADDGTIKEFTAFFAVPGTEINDDNEIQAEIAKITGAKVKETWLTGQTAQEAVGTMIAGGE